MVNQTAATGFSANADTYHRGRPTYHPSLVRRVVDRYGSGTVVELGAGTGIFTRQVMELGASLIAVEPVLAMRTALLEALPDADVRVGAAENIPLDDGTVDSVIAAQAFHWFDHRAALDEIHRVLKTGGHLVTVWNVRDETVPWVATLTKVVDRYAGDTPRYRDMAWRRAINSDARFGSIDEWRMANPIVVGPDDVVNRILSTSFISTLPEDKQAEVEQETRDIVADLGDEFEFPYVSQLQAWRALGVDPEGDPGEG
ncbi:MAG: class I SAM-dependent methyltransferase [Acidimicrobiales bacterium]